MNGTSQTGVLLQVYPIPSSGPVTIVASGLTKTDKLEIHDGEGRLIQEVDIENNTTIQLTNLKPGIYWLHLKSGKADPQKIIIQ